MSNPGLKTAVIDHKEEKIDLPSYMTSYQIFVRNISISQISPSSQETTNPYVTIRLKGGQKYAMTKSQANTYDANYDEVLQLDGQCVGSDILILYVYNQNGEQDPDEDECLGLQKLVISSLELGLVKDYDLKLYKTIDGSTKKDYDVKPGVAGVLHIQMQIAKLGTVQFNPNPWPPMTFYTLWIHVDRCKNVYVNSKKDPINPFIITKISPCLNSQKQTTPVCFNNSNPVWNILQCFHIDNYEKQTVQVTLMNYEEKSAPKKISSLTIPINLAKSIGQPFVSQMLFPHEDRNAKSCTFLFRLQLLEPNSIPFNGIVPMKHQKLQLKLQLYDVLNLPSSDAPQSVYCIVSCGKINKKTNEVQNANPAEINQEITIHDIIQSQLVLINVIVDNKLYGQVPIHLNNYLLDKRTQAQYYSIYKKASAAIKYDLIMTSEEPENEDKEETSDQIDESIVLTIPADINKYKNNYDKSSASSSAASSAANSAIASAASSPQKAANDTGGSDRIKALLQQAKAGEMSKAVESTTNNGAYVPKAEGNNQSSSSSVNRVKQLASQINNAQSEPEEKALSPAIPLPPQSSNKANLAQKYLSQVSSNQKTVQSTTTTTTSTTTSSKQKQEISVESHSVQEESNPENTNNIKLTADQTNENSESSESSGANPVLQAKPRSMSTHKAPIRRLSAIINSNHNLNNPSESEPDSEATQSESNNELYEPSSVPVQSVRRRYSTIRNRRSITVLDEESVDDDVVEQKDPEPKPEQRAPPIQRASIAQKYLDQINSQKANKEKKEEEKPKPEPEPQPEEKKINKVMALASKINQVTNSQAEENVNSTHKARRSTFNAKDANSLINQGIVEKRRSSTTDSSGVQAFQDALNESANQSNQQLTEPKEQQESESSQPQSPRVDNRANLAQKFLNQINSNKTSTVQSKSVVTQSSTSTTSQSQSTESQTTETPKLNRVQQLVNQTQSNQQLNEPKEQQESESSQPQSPRVDNRANLAQKFLNQINSNKTSTVQSKSVVTQSSTSKTESQSQSQSSESQITETPKFNRVQQLANQINIKASGQKEDTVQTPERTRRATDAANSISSTPNFDNTDKRRSSHNDSPSIRALDVNQETPNRVKQLANQINSKTSGQAENSETNQTLERARRATDASGSISSTPNFDNIDKRRASHNDSPSIRALDANQEKPNRVKQLANQINSKTSGQTDNSETNQTLEKARRGSDATNVISSAPNFDNIDKRRLSQNDSPDARQSKINRVQQLINKINANSQASPTTSPSKAQDQIQTQSQEQIHITSQSSSSSSFVSSTTSIKSVQSTTSTSTKAVQSSTTTKSSTISSKTAESSKSSDIKSLQSSTEVKKRDVSILDVEHSANICEFNWGSNDSVYSSSFTGYSECSRSLGSTNSSSAERFHGNRHEDNDPNYKIKPEWHQKVFGKFISAKNLPIKTGKIYATLQLRGLGGLKHFKFTTDEVDPSNLMFNKQISFDRVKKGDSIEIVLYAKNDNDEEQIPFASAKISCRNLKENIDEMYNVKLEKPTRLLYDGKKLNDIKDFGEVQMSLNSNVEFTVLE